MDRKENAAKAASPFSSSLPAIPQRRWRIRRDPVLKRSLMRLTKRPTGSFTSYAARHDDRVYRSPRTTMTKITITTKTPDQIAAEFEAAFKDVPLVTKTKKLTHADRLEPYRKAVMKERKKGRPWGQIAAIMSQPPIKEPATERLLRTVFGRAATPTPAAPARAPLPRLILDPATGLPVPPKTA